MFSIEEGIFYHDQAIDLYGGSKGVRDFGALDSALLRPWQTFASEDLYPTRFEKAAAILESIILIILSLMEIKERLFYCVKHFLKMTTSQ